MKRYLQAEIDAGMELIGLRKQSHFATYKTIKVRSHISREEAPNERYWEMNKWADQLAMEARNKVIQREMQGLTTYI